MDGTLFDSERQEILAMRRLFCDDMGLEMDEGEIVEYIGVPSREVLEQLAPDRVEEMLPVWLDYQGQFLGESRLFPGVLEILQSLSRSELGVGVVTGQNRHELEATRRHIGIDALIDVWVCADDAAFAKPHPAPVHLALESLGCLPDQAVMVGDTRFDMEAGGRAGTLLGAALWGVRDAASLLEYQPDFIFEVPQQVEDMLLGVQKRKGGSL
jgi:HAD superfamily hydrolase (TIGR01549 family)